MLLSVRTVITTVNLFSVLIFYFAALTYTSCNHHITSSVLTYTFEGAEVNSLPPEKNSQKKQKPCTKV